MHEIGIQQFSNHAPTDDEVTALRARLEGLGCEHISVEIQKDWGEEGIYWEVTAVGVAPREIPVEALAAASATRLLSGADMRAGTLYDAPAPYFDKLLFARRDASLRATRCVLESSSGERLDIVLSRRLIAELDSV